MNPRHNLKEYGAPVRSNREKIGILHHYIAPRQ